MRQLFLEKGAIVVKEVSRPLLDEHSVLVAVHYSFISSGTEVATINNANTSILSNVPYKIKKVIESVADVGVEGTKALIKGKIVGQSTVIGYSCSGRILEVGAKVTRFRSGDLVACAGAGLANHADLVCVPEHLVAKVSSEEHLKLSSITTIGAIALQGVRRAQPQLGETVCVIGLGLLGQITVQLAKLSGCTVVGIDLLPERLALAKQLGADYVYNANDPLLKKEIEFLTQHHGVDHTLITAASKSDAIMQQAMELTRRKGKVIIVGDVGLKLERDPFYKKEIDVLISCSYGPGRYDTTYEQKGIDYPYAYVRWTEQRNMQSFVQLLEQGKLNLAPLMSVETDIEHAAQAYEQITKQSALGVVLRYGAKPEDQSIQSIIIPSQIDKGFRFLPARAEKLRVGLVGAGGFAKIKLLPLMAKIDGIKINAIVDADMGNALSITKLYGAARALSHDEELFNDDLVDVVVIASPHKFHCDQAMRALKSGKAVFMEKPMVSDYEQYARFATFLHRFSDAPLCVDYNRSFSPFMQKVKRSIEKRHSPLIIHYRMNAGYISKDHWVQSDIGAGRIIGEACHIIDLFCFLTDAKPLAVSVEAMHTAKDDIFPTDNFSAQITFQDGSICTLLYTSLGHSQLGKERMELFFDGKTIVMDDYAQLHGFGFPNTFHETTVAPDKGHEALINQFFESVKQPSFTPPISFDRLALVAHLTLVIDSLACQGGGTREIGL